jgi:hypothetical protein
MSIVYHIDKERGLACVVWDGTVTAAEFLGHVQRLISDPEWPPAGKLHLVDLRTASVDDSIDDAVLEQAAELYGQQPKVADVRAAIVAGGEFLKAGAFERWTLRYPMFVFVFNTLQPACEWLGIDPDEAERLLQRLRESTKARRT